MSSCRFQLSPAVILLHDRATGFPTALVQATHLTALRTAAGSAVATDCFARPDAAVLSVFGAGLQADQHVRAVLCVRNIRTVHIVNRTASRAMGLAARLRLDYPAVEFVVHATADSSSGSDSSGPAVTAATVTAAAAAAAALSAALRSSHVICTTTNSSTPLLHLADVSPGAHINAVGGFRPHMHELESTLVAACRIAVDCPAALHSGDLLTPTTLGLIRAEGIREIGCFVDRRKYAHRLRDEQRGDIGFELRFESETEPEALRTSPESVSQCTCAGARVQLNARFRCNYGCSAHFYISCVLFLSPLALFSSLLSDITLFKSVGSAIQDVATAFAVLQRARAQNAGQAAQWQ